MPRPNKDSYFLQMLELVASRSTCGRRSVGAIITDFDGHILSTGYNGVPRNFPHCIDTPCEGRNDPAGDTRRCLAVHAEQNALLQCMDITRAFRMYTSCVPCYVCAKLITNTPIRWVTCATDYADTRAVALFKTANIMLKVVTKSEHSAAY